MASPEVATSRQCNELRCSLTGTKLSGIGLCSPPMPNPKCDLFADHPSNHTKRATPAGSMRHFGMRQSSMQHRAMSTLVCGCQSQCFTQVAHSSAATSYRSAVYVLTAVPCGGHTNVVNDCTTTFMIITEAHDAPGEVYSKVTIQHSNTRHSFLPSDYSQALSRP